MITGQATRRVLGGTVDFIEAADWSHPAGSTPGRRTVSGCPRLHARSADNCPRGQEAQSYRPDDNPVINGFCLGRAPSRRYLPVVGAKFLKLRGSAADVTGQPAQRRDAGEARLWHFGAALGIGVALAVVGLGGLTWLAWALLHYPRLPRTGAISLHDAVGVLQLVFASVAGAGALVALIVAYRRQKIAEADSVHDRTWVFNERFTAIAAQLGDAQPAVRLAGVHAMAGLADDWRANRQTCIDVLCAYLRMPYEPDPGEGAPAAERLAFRAGREVRHTVIRVITATSSPARPRPGRAATLTSPASSSTAARWTSSAPCSRAARWTSAAPSSPAARWTSSAPSSPAARSISPGRRTGRTRRSCPPGRRTVSGCAWPRPRSRGNRARPGATSHDRVITRFITRALVSSARLKVSHRELAAVGKLGVPINVGSWRVGASFSVLCQRS